MTSELFHRGRHSHISMPLQFFFFLQRIWSQDQLSSCHRSVCVVNSWVFVVWWTPNFELLNSRTMLCSRTFFFFSLSFHCTLSLLFYLSFLLKNIQIRQWSCKWWLTWSYWDLNNMLVWLVPWRASLGHVWNGNDTVALGTLRLQVPVLCSCSSWVFSLS